MGFRCVNLFQTHEMDRDQQLANLLKLMGLQHLEPLLLVLSGLWKSRTIANAAILVLNHFLWGSMAHQARLPWHGPMLEAEG